MSNGYFKFENCPLKHHIRRMGWLPPCRARLRDIRQGAKRSSKSRRLRYFTFCAAGAIDVLMLDIARVIRTSSTGQFDTVTFFDKDADSVNETKKNIPGASGFPGDFVQIALGENMPPDRPDEDPLAAPPDAPETQEVTRTQSMHAQRLAFRSRFPFDVINLDLEQFFFKPRDPRPGRLVNALRRILEWQKIPLDGKGIDGFTLMFTTQIGPKNLPADYLEMLAGPVNENLANDQGLLPILTERVGHGNVDRLMNDDFETFFRIAFPKGPYRRKFIFHPFSRRFSRNLEDHRFTPPVSIKNLRTVLHRLVWADEIGVICG